MLACSLILSIIDYCIQHHPEAAVSTKQRDGNHKLGTTMISCQLAAARAVLDACQS